MTESKDMIVHAVPTTIQRSPEAATLDRLQTVKGVLAPDLTDGELELFAMVAVRSGLDPFARQIFAVKRQGKMSIQTGIDGYRSIADRTGLYDGQDEPVYGENCPCPAKPQPHPISATVRVFRKDMSRSVAATAFWHEYKPDNGFMWDKMPHVMLAKVAEALALRKAFPWDPNRGTGIGGDVLTVEEMAQSENVPVPSVSVQDRVASRAQALGAGLTVREFAERVSDMDADLIRAKRSAMFPDVRGVSDLSDAQRLALLDALTGTTGEETEDAVPAVDDGPPLVQQAEAEPEEIEGIAVEVQEDPEPAPAPGPVACEAPSPFTEGAFCLLQKGHRGGHRASEHEGWSR